MILRHGGSIGKISDKRKTPLSTTIDEHKILDTLTKKSTAPFSLVKFIAFIHRTLTQQKMATVGLGNGQSSWPERELDLRFMTMG